MISSQKIGDNSYIPIDEGWLFLAVVVDLFRRWVVSWSLRPDLRSALGGDCFRNGLAANACRATKLDCCSIGIKATSTPVMSSGKLCNGSASGPR